MITGSKASGVKHIYIVGNRGNMGRRYAAILKSLGHEVYGHDVDEDFDDTFAKDCVDGFIIASPTACHITDIWYLQRFNKPILCEKPISKSLDEVRAVAQFKNLRMVNQYACLPLTMVPGVTLYDYFKSGNDGLAWDCINLIGLSTQTPILKNDSPIWRCILNGETLNIAAIDRAYVHMIYQWLEKPESNMEYAVKAHEKVVKYIEENL